LNHQPKVDGADDVALVHAAKLGDSAAFEKLVNRHSALVYRVVRHIVPTSEDAEDVVQDAFLSAFEHLLQFEERARFSSWVTRIAVHNALAKVHRLRRFPVMPIHDEVDSTNLIEDQVVDWRPTPEQIYGNAELRVILQKALASLPEIYRLVFVLRDIECLSVAEAAALLGISISNVKVRLFRARLQLRQQLGKHFERRGKSAEPPRSRNLLASCQSPAIMAG
jgi:RNA polymerase sigma-70 factor (ECF subfamily)